MSHLMGDSGESVRGASPFPIVSVLQVVPGLHPADGGPSRTVVQLSGALARQPGVQVTLLSQRRVGDPVVESPNQNVCLRIAESRANVSLIAGLPARAGLLQVFERAPFELLHSNGIWTPVNHWVSRFAARQKIPLVVQPRGMLEPWALAFRGWKKRLALSLYQRRDLRSAALFIATAEQEAESIRRVGLQQPIAVIPNGVQLDVAESIACDRSSDAGIHKALFLSRVHQKKGLLNLVAAWGRVRPSKWRLVIAGPDEGGFLAEVLSAVRREGIQDLVEYVGEVEGKAKAELYHSADLFVLPTFSENFGIVVAEALAYGIPVITTRGAPWADLKTYGCGWWIDIGVEPLVVALREAIGLSDEERQAMGEHGREYVRRYDWGDIARQTADVYRWVLGRGPKPACVYLD